MAENLIHDSFRNLDHAHLTQIMALDAEHIRNLAQGITIETARWRPSAESWSILEVINHLYDEERLDFRARLDMILHHPGKPWEPINPKGWVIEHKYNERELETSLQSFLDERNSSLEWLKGLTNPDWNTAAQAPFGVIRAGDMLAAWAAHDLLHMRQLVELHYAWVVQQVRPYQVQYAGDW
jgi:hypothetical protein